MTPDANKCPDNIRKSIDAYAARGLEPGGFVRALLENNLYNAVSQADIVNVRFIPECVAYLLTMPFAIWGSSDKVARHLKAKRNEMRATRSRESATPLLNREEG